MENVFAATPFATAAEQTSACTRKRCCEDCEQPSRLGIRKISSLLGAGDVHHNLAVRCPKHRAIITTAVVYVVRLLDSCANTVCTRGGSAKAGNFVQENISKSTCECSNKLKTNHCYRP